MEKKQENSALHVNKGVEQPPTVDENSVKRFLKTRRNVLSLSQYVDGILAGDRVILGRAITLIESSHAAHQHLAQDIVEACLPHSGKSRRIGITGVPGVGKSTFIEAFGNYLTTLGQKIAVLAIDPSSERSKGSILGDKTRMESLATNESVFIRPSPSTGTLGGVANKTRESIILCEAAGYSNIFIETVGVGQSETIVHSMVDFFLLLMLAGAGDELQGIKRGIMEMADAVVITKADGSNKTKAQQARISYENALHLFPPAANNWTPRVLTCSAYTNEGIEAVWEVTQTFFSQQEQNQFLAERRKSQARHWMHQTINEFLLNDFYQNESVRQQLENLEQQVLGARMNPYAAAKILLDNYYNKK